MNTWMVSEFHYFILLLILTDLKDGKKKKMLTLSFYEIDQTLYN